MSDTMKIEDLGPEFRIVNESYGFCIAAINPRSGNEEALVRADIRTETGEDKYSIKCWPEGEAGWQEYAVVDTREEAEAVCIALIGMGMYKFL